jgi:hypothetical protein
VKASAWREGPLKQATIFRDSRVQVLLVPHYHSPPPRSSSYIRQATFMFGSAPRLPAHAGPAPPMRPR